MDMFVKFNRNSIDDRKLDIECTQKLFSVLQKISGDQSEVGKLAKPETLPLCSPLPKIEFNDRSFLFTGMFVFGSRALCKQATAILGGTSTQIFRSQ